MTRNSVHDAQYIAHTKSNNKKLDVLGWTDLRTSRIIIIYVDSY